MNSFKFLRGGADPEVFALTSDGNPMSVEGLLGGSKYEPLPMEGLPEGFAIQEDNVAAEYNIPPATNAGDFSHNIALGLQYVEECLKKKGLSLAIVSAMEFPMDQLGTVHAQTLGCEPDFNVWLDKENLRPICPPQLRTAAGHVHFGWFEPTKEQQIAFGKLCDLHLGAASILVTDRNERRKLYGKAGAVRFKTYGVEYRVLDNFWIGNRAQSEHIFNTGVRIAEILNKGGDLVVDEVDKFSDEIQVAINSHNRDWAIELMSRFDVAPFPNYRVPKLKLKKGYNPTPTQAQMINWGTGISAMMPPLMVSEDEVAQNRITR